MQQKNTNSSESSAFVRPSCGPDTIANHPCPFDWTRPQVRGSRLYGLVPAAFMPLSVNLFLAPALVHVKRRTHVDSQSARHTCHRRAQPHLKYRSHYADAHVPFILGPPFRRTGPMEWLATRDGLATDLAKACAMYTPDILSLSGDAIHLLQ
jgi:hypothetical protein